MNGFEFNKLFAALLVAGILASSSGFIARHLVHVNLAEVHGVEESSGAGGGEPAKAALPEPVLELIAAADSAQGQKLFKACATCHNSDKGGPDGVGPHLWNIMTRGKAATSFAYSDAMKGHAGQKWSYLDLNKFLWKPKSLVPGTKMTFVGLKKPEDRAAVIAYLRTLADSPPGLPSGADIAAEKAELTPPEAAPAKEGADGAPATAPDAAEAAKAAPAH